MLLDQKSLKEFIKEIIKISNSIQYNGYYSLNPFYYKRFPTRKVRIGNLYIGGDEPIRIQSMTTTNTLDIEATFKETKALFDAGCEIVRITTRTPNEAKAIKEIKEKLIQHGYDGPIVADIHFSPQTAMIAAEYADKVRINPGNFVDTKKFEIKEYSDDDYEKEILKIHDALKPLILKLKENRKSLRIGVNHGSLSDRILNRFGDTPEGMVESAIEFIKICEYYDFYDIVVSMKASNPIIMIQAYKILIERFIKEKMNYPIHLGVTEAGDGKDGRLKSYSGIGLLLLEGIGDTIRVSLTEDPVNEIPAAKEIINFINKITKENNNLYTFLKNLPQDYQDSYQIKSNAINYDQFKIGKDYPIRYILKYSAIDDDKLYKDIEQNPPDYFLIEDKNSLEKISNNSKLKNIPLIIKITFNKDFIFHYNFFKKIINDFHLFIDINTLNISHLEELNKFIKYNLENNLILLNIKISDEIELCEKLPSILKNWEELNKPIVYSLDSSIDLDIIHFYKYIKKYTQLPFLLKLNIKQKSELNLVRLGILGAGSIFSGIVNLLLIDSPDITENYQYTLDVLQITRNRLTRADFISCPSCGRTLFNLQETTSKIKNLTEHLSGVKIAIMGCIVNGLGEMADADFGYVGASPGKVNLYQGKKLIKRNVPEENAPFELVQIIKDAGMWKEKH